MVQALKTGELDYARNVNPDQFKQLQADPAYKTVAGKANGWTQLAFNTYGTGTGKTIKDGGPSTKALLDPKFRDALGYAVDKQALVDRVLGGFGDAGTTDRAADPLATGTSSPTRRGRSTSSSPSQKLDAAGYKLDANGKRLDKEGKPIKLRLYAPDTEATYAKSAQFVKDWYGQLGIAVSTAGPHQRRARRAGPAARGRRDRPTTTSSCGAGPATRIRTRCSQIFRCDAIGSTSDSQYCNPEYDKLYDLQLTQAGAERAGRRWPRCRT